MENILLGFYELCDGKYREWNRIMKNKFNCTKMIITHFTLKYGHLRFFVDIAGIEK